jgi:hypothetical protein
MEKVQNTVIELGLMTGLVIDLTIALYFTRRLRWSDPRSTGIDSYRIVGAYSSEEVSCQR